jgi:Ni/Co efflux regulator RcnB
MKLSHFVSVAKFAVARPALVAVVAVAMIATPLAAQQDKQSQMSKPGKDSHIKSDSDQNSPTAPESATNTARATRAKGGSTEGTCEVRIHNFTNLKVKIFINGDYTALAAPYGNLTITGDAGTKLEVYERADFAGGKEYKFWSTSTYDCSSGQQVDENLT